MGDITKQDLKTILLFALHLARVDQDFTGKEKTLLKRFMEVSELSEADRAELAGSGSMLASRLDELSGPEAKNLLVKTLCAVAYADQSMHPSEEAFLQKVQALLGGGFKLPPFAEWDVQEAEVLRILADLS